MSLIALILPGLPGARVPLLGVVAFGVMADACYLLGPAVEIALEKLAPPITLEHVTVPSSRFCGEGELRPPPAGDGRERFFRPHMPESIIEGLRIHIDRDLCVSFGDCIEAAPGVFEFDDEEIAVFVSDAGPISREGLIEACASCPVDALTAFDEEGEPLAP